MFRYPTVLLFRHLHRRKLSSTTSQPHLPLSHPIYLIWGSNTGVGKTLVSTGIAASSLLSSPSSVKFHYLKPLQTGFHSDSNSRFILNKLKPFRIPAILVGDGWLGGISGTISAYESLALSGYDVAAVIFEDHGLLNEGPLLCYMRNK